MRIIGIDPGLTGAIVCLEDNEMRYWPMPLTDKEICFDTVYQLLRTFDKKGHVFLERAMPMAMGSKAAFNYGRGFMTIEMAIKLSGMPVTYVEPLKWSKIIHEGISNDLKPKAKSLIAVKRLFPTLSEQIPVTPKSKKMHEGVVDALLIAEYGRRML